MKVGINSARGITMTVTVYETRQFKLRKWVALKLFWLAGFILGMEVEIRLQELP